MTSIVLNFIQSGGDRISLIGTSFTVTPINSVTVTTPAVYEEVTSKPRWGKPETTKIVIEEAKTVEKPYNGLTIQGGAMAGGYNYSYHAKYRAPDISFADYAAALTQASEQQAGRPLVVVDLATIQQANAAKPS